MDIKRRLNHRGISRVNSLTHKNPEETEKKKGLGTLKIFEEEGKINERRPKNRKTIHVKFSTI